MQVSHLRIENFRNIAAATFEGDLAPDAHMNILYGINGSGKTTVLESLATLLSWQTNRRLQSSGGLIPLPCIRHKASSCVLALEVQHSGQTYSWSLTRSRSPVAGKSLLQDISRLNTALTSEAEYPLSVYYPVTRAVLDMPLRIRTKHTFSPASAFEKSLSRGIDFRTFFEWFRVQEDLENEAYRTNSKTWKEDWQLAAVRSALTSFMPGFKDWRIRRDPIRMEVNKQGIPCRVDQLSDGEKCMFALIGDIARRLALANMEHKDRDPLKGSGIIMIDEIDLHLHPLWQQTIIFRLKTTFPNCQFFVSTHSPLVLNQEKAGSLFFLKEKDGQIEIHRPDASYGRTGEQVLLELMGLKTTRTEEVSDHLTRIYQPIDPADYSTARELIPELRKQIGPDPELARAEMRIYRKELIGK